MFSFPLLLTAYAGFTHAFEADHLLAVSNIVSGRNNVKQSLKDGIYWGLGHTSTIFLIGILMILLKASIPEYYFSYFEAVVGLMLVVLAIYRLLKYFQNKKSTIHSHEHNSYEHNHQKHQHSHTLAYGVGLVHGLAGSGALVVMVMSQMKSPADGIMYLIIFGIGSILGMFVAAGIFSVPFSKRWIHTQSLQSALILISSLLCLVYGIKVIYENLFT